MKETTKAYLKKYKKEKCVQICISLSKEHDADIIDYIQKQNNKQGLIKALIRSDIPKKKL